MPHTVKHILAFGCLGAAILGGAGCAPKTAPPLNVTDLMEDRVMLDGVLLKCNANPDKLRNSSDCMNARVAVERLAQDVDPTVEAKRNADFERSREQLRISQEKVRREQEEKTKVDAYSLPLVPVDSAPGAGGASGSGSAGAAAATGGPATSGGATTSGLTAPGYAAPGLAQAKP
jgi:hypothetical protein